MPRPKMRPSHAVHCCVMLCHAVWEITPKKPMISSKTSLEEGNT